ncbi:CAP domain-containing protein [Hydrogenophaga sp.]|uniref:CAP domain-containing protein n=1 Tax=Hydrogenophaga sp. TaxID=1904254 RepID=UPI0025C4CC74|nr:CAP domain-containing protein [Hydrogenophaga sp.]
MQHLSLPSEQRLAGVGLILGVLLALTACGGGGGGGGDAGASGGADATIGVPSPPNSAGGAGTGGGGSTLVALDASTSCNLPDFRNSLLQQINAARAAARSCGGTAMPAVAPLAWNDALFSAAARHSTDMAVNNYFSHTGLDGRSASQRIAAEGYAWSWVGENIAAGQTSVSTVMSGWLASAGHCANLMRAEYQHVGVSCVQRSGTTYGRYWTMTLARPR